jgi:hypothetical protein
MKRFSILILITLFALSAVKAQFTTTHAPKNVSVAVKLQKDSVGIGAAIPITITLTNTGKAEQKLLLDKPKATGAPWGIWASITNLKTRQQAVMYQSRAIFSNTFYTEDKLKDDYYTVKPGESISAGYDLLDVVMVGYRERYLPKGDYELQITYYKAVSKKLKFTVL